jgi:hypothetical protein
LKGALAADGHVDAAIVDLTVSIELWRKTARAAARALGRPVQTLETERYVHALLRDWPANAEEEAKFQARMRAAMESVPSPFRLDDF